jgi:hypothetical protein
MTGAPKGKKPRVAARPPLGPCEAKPAEGARKGAGRPLGSANKKTLEIANKAAEQGITPLEVMINIMREAYGTKDYEKALDAAVKAAPYMHSKLSSVDLKASVKRDVEEYTDAELIAIAMQSRRSDPESPEPSQSTH